MTRTEVLAQYRPIREAIRRVLRGAAKVCSRADLDRAAKQVAPWAMQDELENGTTADMLVDVALFEPNRRGHRAFDRFLASKADRLDASDRALAQCMTGAWFSLFRAAERHAAAGIWLKDLLHNDRHLWLVDEALEATASEGVVFGMRLFDAGPFHAGFGIIVEPDKETIDFCLAARERGDSQPFRHSLATTLYGDQLRADTPTSPADLTLLLTLFETLIGQPITDTEDGQRRCRRRPTLLCSSKPHRK